MKVLILGADGMLGSMLCNVFSDSEPTCWDKNDVDITDENQAREKIRKIEPNIIINAAAFTDVDGAEINKQAAFAVNEGGVRNLASIAKELDAILVHYSTDYVFPGDREAGYKEDDSPGPAVNVYGESKLAGERALVEIGPKFYLQRISWLYGPNGGNFVNTMLDLGATYDNLTVVNDQHGGPTFTKDVAEATKTLIEEQYPFGIYHTPNEGTATWYEFANKIFQISHTKVDVKPCGSEEYQRPANRPKWSVLVNTKGPRMRPWIKALEEYLLG